MRPLILLGIWVVVVVFSQFWPFDLRSWIAVNGAGWLRNQQGIELTSRGILHSFAPPRAAYDRILATGEFSVEAWAATATLDQRGPARIVSYSPDIGHRNLTLGQSDDGLVIRLRTTNPRAVSDKLPRPEPLRRRVGLGTGLGEAEVTLAPTKTVREGLFTGIRFPAALTAGKLQHLVATYDAGFHCAYVDGAPRGCVPAAGGELSNWDSGYPLVLGNERTGNRPWIGRLASVAIFDRALSAESVAERFHGGPIAAAMGEPITLFAFTEGQGDVVHDTGVARPATDLSLPLIVVNGNVESVLTWRRRQFQDVVWNALLFAPLAMLLCLVLMVRRTSGAAIALSFLITLSVCAALELMQLHVISRTSSAFDLAFGALGAAAGAAVGPLLARSSHGTTAE